jgi:hypothetical protein
MILQTRQQPLPPEFYKLIEVGRRVLGKSYVLTDEKKGLLARARVILRNG